MGGYGYGVFSESLKIGLFDHIWVLGVSCPPKKRIPGQTPAGQVFLLLLAKLGQCQALSGPPLYHTTQHHTTPHHTTAPHHSKGEHASPSP